MRSGKTRLLCQADNSSESVRRKLEKIKTEARETGWPEVALAVPSSNVRGLKP